MSRSDAGSVVAVGIDGSVESRVATQYALDVAAARHRGVLVVHAYQPPWLVGPVTTAFTPSMQQSAESLVAETLAGLVLHPSVHVDSRIALDDPVTLLREVSEHASLLVLGRHHFTLADQLLTGSVASPLAAKAACPVVIVPRTWDRTRSDPRPVVVTIDGETPATAALDYAFGEAEMRRSGLIALHAAPLHELEYLNSLERASVGEILAGQKQDHPDVSVTTLMVEGAVTDRIIEASREAAVLVVGRPHHHGPVTLWTRSVAHAVLARSECPLVVVPQAGPATEAVPEGAAALRRPSLLRRWSADEAGEATRGSTG